MAVEIPFLVFRRQSARLDFTVSKPPDQGGGPEDITGWAIKFQLLDSYANWAAPLVTRTVGSGVTITSGPAGQCQVTLTQTHLDWSPTTATARYYFTLSRTDTGVEDQLAYGEVYLDSATVP